MDDYGDLYHHMNVYHGFADKDCELVKIEAYCEDFEMVDGRCRIDAEYCRDEEYFRCTMRGTDEDDNKFENDCTE